MDGTEPLVHNDWMTVVETGWLIEQASASRFVVEVGCWRGITTRNVASRTQASYYCVDTWPTVEENTCQEIDFDLRKKQDGWVYQEFISNTGHLKNVTVVRMPSVDAAKHLSHIEFDMVFIDADHSYQRVHEDLMAWGPLVRKGGLLCGHDYNISMDYAAFGVNKAVDELVPRHAIVPNSTIWYTRR